MPRWPDWTGLGTVFLYRTVEDAESDADTGGTGFLVGLPWEQGNGTHWYAVTNHHVACRDGFSVIRMNTRDGKSQTIDADRWYWLKGHDLAVHRIEASEHFAVGHIFDFRAPMYAEIKLAQEIIDQYSLGIGDEVFSVGRFTDLSGQGRNVPLVRSGIVALMTPTLIRTDTPWKKEPVRVVEMRSRSGFSGSPVYIYIDVLTTRLIEGEHSPVDPWKFHGPWLLGVHSGQFPADQNNPDPAGAGSGMATVVPCEALTTLLQDEKTVAERKEYEDRWRKNPKVQLESASDHAPAESEPGHKERFNRLLDAAVQKPEQDD